MYSSYLRSKLTEDESKQNQDFFRWIDTIEELVFQRTELYLSDIDDEPYRWWYEQNLTAEQCANYIINDIQSTYGMEL